VIRTGLVVPIPDVRFDQAETMVQVLTERFPGVVVAIVPGQGSPVAFEWEDRQ
jgi:hypothetical protein